MCAKKSSDVATASTLDFIMNVINVGLFVLGIFLITLGIVYIANPVYDYLVRIGTIIIIGGIIGMVVGVWGIINHARIVRRMQVQAKANLNY
jgi:uncharacterized membrane protein YfcA